MKITLRAGGIIRRGPERDLIDDYLKRTNGLIRQCGLHSVTEQQIDLRSRKNRTDQTEKLLSNLPAGSKLVILDEKGKSLSSRQLANAITKLRDNGTPELILVIGGADGFDPYSIEKGTEKWAFGHQTWPHKLVRVMLAEQLYRAMSILTGSPYHRD